MTTSDAIDLAGQLWFPLYLTAAIVVAYLVHEYVQSKMYGDGPFDDDDDPDGWT